MNRLVLPVAAAAALLLPATAAGAKVKVSIPGWTTAPVDYTPQVKNGKTIVECRDTGNGQRSIFVIFKGKGISKGTKVAAKIWGGSNRTGFDQEPSDADTLKNAFKWPVGKKKSYTERYGFSMAPGPFGPVDINGVWNAKIFVKGKLVKTGTVTVAC